MEEIGVEVICISEKFEAPADVCVCVNSSLIDKGYGAVVWCGEKEKRFLFHFCKTGGQPEAGMFSEKRRVVATC